MKGFLDNLNPSEYVRIYVDGKKEGNPRATTQRLKKLIAKSAVSSNDTEVYGAILLIVELKLQRAYSSVVLNGLVDELIKAVHDNAIIKPENYARYRVFVNDYSQKVHDQIMDFAKTGKSEPELMQDNHFFRLAESYYIFKQLKQDLLEVYYHHYPNKRPKTSNEQRVE